MRANRENGGNASAPAAPETKAIARRRQPQERITPSTSEPSTLTRGMAVEPARLKEHPSWTVESPSPTIDPTGARFDSARRGRPSPDIAAHIWSEARFARADPGNERRPSLDPVGRPRAKTGASPQKPAKMKRLSFVFFNFSEPGLFRHLRPIQLTFFSSAGGSAASPAARPFPRSSGPRADGAKIRLRRNIVPCAPIRRRGTGAASCRSMTSSLRRRPASLCR